MEDRRPSYIGPHTRTWVLRTATDTDGELFEVKQGAMVYLVDGEQRRIEAGESLELPPGTTHKARNASAAESAVIRWEARPALRSEIFFRTAAALSEAGALEQAMLAHEFRDVFRVSGPLALLVPPLAALARLLGRSLPHVGL